MSLAAPHDLVPGSRWLDLERNRVAVVDYIERGVVFVVHETTYGDPCCSGRFARMPRQVFLDRYRLERGQ